MRARALVGLVAELLEGAVAVAPIFHYFDIEVEEAFFAGELLDVFAGFVAYLFDGFATGVCVGWISVLSGWAELLSRV